MAEDYLKDVAIIGAGLGGCALALALSDQNIPIKIYESRPEISDVIPSGVILTPNGLRVLDNIGIFSRIRHKCYIPLSRVFKNDKDETTKKVASSDPEKFGYMNHRIWRKLLFDEMRLMLKERGVEIDFSSRFEGVIEEGEEGVTFRIGEQEKNASLLIGADGIYSSVRKYIVPSIVPEYTGLIGIISHIKRSSVSWPNPDYESNATIQSAPGAIFWIAEDPAGEDLMIGKQIHYPEQSKQDLENLQRDKKKLAEFYQKDYEAYGPTARKIIDSVCANPETLYIWPFMKMPELPRWYSETGRLILLGDGAHALPPSSGQGVNQALEDVYSLTLVLSSLRDQERRDGDGSQSREKSLLEALAFWQKLRQERIDAVLDWTNNGSNVSRLPEAERKKLIADGKVKENQFDDMTWLYKPGIYEDVKTWIEGTA